MRDFLDDVWWGARLMLTVICSLLVVVCVIGVVLYALYLIGSSLQ